MLIIYIHFVICRVRLHFAYSHTRNSIIGFCKYNFKIIIKEKSRIISLDVLFFFLFLIFRIARTQYNSVLSLTVSAWSLRLPRLFISHCRPLQPFFRANPRLLRVRIRFPPPSTYRYFIKNAWPKGKLEKCSRPKIRQYCRPVFLVVITFFFIYIFLFFSTFYRGVLAITPSPLRRQRIPARFN